MAERRLKGRVSKLQVGRTLEFGQVAAALREANGIKYKAARMLGCSPSALSKAIKKDSRLGELLSCYNEVIVDIARDKLFEDVENGDQKAYLFALSRLDKLNFSERQELTGKDGADLNIDSEQVKEDIKTKLMLALSNGNIESSSINIAKDEEKPTIN